MHQHLPKRDVAGVEKGGDILAGGEVGVEGEVALAGERGGQRFSLREFGENVVDGEEAGEEQEERWEDDK